MYLTKNFQALALITFVLLDNENGPGDDFTCVAYCEISARAVTVGTTGGPQYLPVQPQVNEILR